MTRKPRIHRQGAFYHVMLRGNNGQNIFHSDKDRIKFCLQVQEGIERFNHTIHGFCLMTNHIHLIIKITDISLSDIIKHLAGSYAQYFNMQQNRIGHLFQGRFKSILVDEENYLTELVRYVHLNPVRAGIVKRPEYYLWSGHRTLIGLDKITWLTSEWILGKFHPHKKIAQNLYREFIDRGINLQTVAEIKNGTHRGALLASDDFAENFFKESPSQLNILPEYSLDDLLEVVSSILNMPIPVIKGNGSKHEYVKARAIVGLLIKKSSHLKLQTFADLIGKNISSISRSTANLEIQIRSDSDLHAIIEQIKTKLKSLSKI